MKLDIAHGLVGKTAIHPSQIRIIQDTLRVSLEDLNCAKLIVNDVARRLQAQRCNVRTGYSLQVGSEHP